MNPNHLSSSCSLTPVPVGVTNVVRGYAKTVTGGIEVAAGGFVTAILGPEVLPITGPEMGWGAASTIGGALLVRRGSAQLAQCQSEEESHWQNILGLLPFGGLYDDPGEFKDAWKSIKQMSWIHKIGELFTF